ncbi:MAG: hypothetical protein IPK19_00480 [Chloroflexi bacterium]|nr:hypothetical protein [Chloroflexota bacterium]
MTDLLPSQLTTALAERRMAGAVGAVLLAAYFVLIGLFAIVLLAAAVLVDPGVQSAVGWVPLDAEAVRPSVILAFLDSFGLVVPLLALGLGGLFIVLGLRLARRQMSAARWAQIALVWVIAGLILFLILNVIDEFQRLSRTPNYAFGADRWPAFSWRSPPC